MLFNEAKKQSGAIKSIEDIKSKTEKKLEKLQNKTESEQEIMIVTEIRKKIGMRDIDGLILLMIF